MNKPFFIITNVLFIHFGIVVLQNDMANADPPIYEQEILCRWPIMGCQMTCDTLHPNLTPIIEDYWNERSACHGIGMHLNLGTVLRNYFLTLPQNWLTAIVRITDLTLDARNLENIEPGAFMGIAFRTIDRLEIRGPGFLQLNRGVFVGLVSLTRLIIAQSTIHSFQNGVLNPIASTIQSLTLIGSGAPPDQRVVSLDGLTDGVPAPFLITVRIQVNLNDTITARTFNALTALRSLELNGCEITLIRPDIFDQMSNTIEALRLEFNLFQTLPVGIFNRMLQRGVARVFVNGIRWHCDCNLCYTQWLIGNNFNFDPHEQLCATPSNKAGSAVSLVSLCVIGSCSPFVILPPDTTKYVQPKCFYDLHTFDTIQIQPADRNLFIRIISNSSIFLNVDPFGLNGIIIWMDYKNNEIVHCRRHKSPIQINQLILNVTYLICTMEKQINQMSPFNCISYHSREPTLNWWLSTEDQLLVITSLVLIVILCIIIGFIIMYVLICSNPIWCLDGVKNVTVVRSFSNDILTTNSSKRQPYRRQSADSVTSSNYAVALNMSQFEIIKRRLEREYQEKLQQQRDKRDDDYIYADIAPYEVAPSRPLHAPCLNSSQQVTNGLADADDQNTMNNYLVTLNDSTVSPIHSESHCDDAFDKAKQNINNSFVAEDLYSSSKIIYKL